MNSGDDESSTSLNVRLRPRKPPNTTQVPKGILRKSTDKNIVPKGITNLNKNKDLVDKADFPLSHQYLCIYCEKSFSSKQTVSNHIRRIHLSSQQKQDPNAKCMYCSHAESDLNDIIQHMLCSHPDNYFACLDCHTRLSSACELKEHKSNLCENRKVTSHLPTSYKNTNDMKRNKRTPKNKTRVVLSKIEKEVQESSDFASIVISCELKPPHVRNEEDIEDNITTNVILPGTKPLNNSAIIERSGLIVLDDLHWGRRIPQGLSFHNTDADQILSRLGVVHRSPRTGESTKKESKPIYDESTQKFEKCFDTNFYSKVASNVQENLAKYLDGSFNFKPNLDNVVTTRRSKYNVTINTVEGFPILLACEQYLRNNIDAYSPRASEMKHKWKWGHVECEKSLLRPNYLTTDSHTSNCIITLVSSLDIWTQLRMRKKFDEIYNRFSKVKVNEKQNILGKELKEILESREISRPGQIMPYQNRQKPIGNKIDFSTSLGLVPAAPQYKVEPAILSGEWVRPRCYVCCACGAQTRDSRTLTSHISTQHPYAQVQHYEIVGELLLNSDILRHLYVPPSPVSNRTRPLRGFKECTKCNKSISLKDLHQHMLDCAGDTPAVRRKQCRYRLFGVRKRRPRLPDNTVRKKIRRDIRNRPEQRKSRMRPRQKIRSEVGDAETIRKMIADLPAKRQRVMTNPHQITRSRRSIHFDNKINKLALKRRLSGESSKVKDVRRNGNNSPTSRVKASIKSKLVRVKSTHKNNAIINRKVALTRLKKKSILAKEKSEKILNEISQETTKSSNSCSLTGQSERTFLKNTSGTAKEHGNQNGSTNHNQHCPGSEGGQNTSNNANMPTQNIPLKHSIARLTANSEKHDKSVQFHHSFLVRQDFNNADQTIKQFDDKSGPQILFENEEAATKPDKPPINLFQIESIENRNRFRQSKPRKGLNDCIAMLKNKLTDVSQIGHVSVKCGSDEPLKLEVTSLRSTVQENIKNDLNISANLKLNESTDQKSRRTSENDQTSSRNTNAVELTESDFLPQYDFSKDTTNNIENINRPYNELIHDLPPLQVQPEQIQLQSNLLTSQNQDLSRLCVRLADQDIVIKQKINTSTTASLPAQVFDQSHSTIRDISKATEGANSNKNQHAIDNLIEMCPKQQKPRDNYISKSQKNNSNTEKRNSSVEMIPDVNLNLFTTEIPIAHASTNVESIMSTPLDLSLKVYTSSNKIYSTVNNDDYETLDLSNKNIESKSVDDNFSEYVVDLSIKSIYKQSLETLSEQENIPTDLSSRAKFSSTNTFEPGTSKNTLNPKRSAENLINESNANTGSYVTNSELQYEIDSLTSRRIAMSVDVAKLQRTAFPADYCLPTDSDKNMSDLVWNSTTGKVVSSLEQNYTEGTTDDQLSGDSYQNIPVVENISLQSKDYSNMGMIESRITSLSANSIQNNLYVQHGSAINLAGNIFTGNAISTAQNTTSITIVNKITSEDKSLTSITPDATYSQTKSDNGSKDYESQDYVTASSSTPISYSGSVSQLDSIKLLIEEEQNKQKKIGKENIEDSFDITRKLAMLPKELVDVLGKMPVDHRNQLLNILKQYISSSTSTASPYEAAKSYMSTAGLLVDKNIAMLNKQQAGDNTVTTSEPQASNQLNISPNVSQPKTSQLKPDKINGQGQTEPIVISKTIQSNMSSGRIVDLTEIENVPHVKLLETNLSADYCPSERAVKQRVYSDQTASLRAVRIKAPAERRKEFNLINKADLKGPNYSESCESSNEFLAIQQAEISSTQHGVRHLNTESHESLLNEREPILKHSNSMKLTSDDKTSVDSEMTNLKTAMVTSSVVSKESQAVLESKNGQQKDLQAAQCQETHTENKTEHELDHVEGQVLKFKQDDSKNNATENESDDDISLALIVKQKHSSQITECKSKTNKSSERKSKRKMKKLSQALQKRDKSIEVSSSSITDHFKNRKTSNENKNYLTNETNISLRMDGEESNTQINNSETSHIAKEIKINDEKTTDESIKTRKGDTEAKIGMQLEAITNSILTNESLLKSSGDIRREETEPVPPPADKSLGNDKDVSEVEMLPISISQIENPTNQNSIENSYVDTLVDIKCTRKSHRLKKSIVSSVESKGNIPEESVPLRRSRRGKSLIVGDLDKSCPESKPLLTKKQLIFSKLLLDNEVMHTDLSSDGKITDNNELAPTAKDSTLNKNVKSLIKDTDKSSLQIIKKSESVKCTVDEPPNRRLPTSEVSTQIFDPSVITANKSTTEVHVGATYTENKGELLTSEVSTQIFESSVITANKSTAEVHVGATYTENKGKQLNVKSGISSVTVSTFNEQSHPKDANRDSNSSLSVKFSSDVVMLATVEQSSSNNDKSAVVDLNRAVDYNLECKRTDTNQIFNEQSNSKISGTKITADEGVSRHEGVHDENESPLRKVVKEDSTQNLAENLLKTDDTSKTSPKENITSTHTTNETSILLPGEKLKNVVSIVKEETLQSSSVKSASDVIFTNVDNNLNDFAHKNKSTKESPGIESVRVISKNSKSKYSTHKNFTTDKNMESDLSILDHHDVNKEKKSVNKQQHDDVNDDFDIPIAARRGRSKSVVVKTSYDPYDIEMDLLDEEMQPLTSLLKVKEKRKSTLNLSKSKLVATAPIAKEVHKINTTFTSSESTKVRAKPGKKRVGNKLTKKQEIEENAVFSDDSTKSDVPLQKYVKEKKNADFNKRTQKVFENSKSKLTKINNDIIHEEKESDKLKCSDNLESDEQLRSEQFMESFGFFSKRKPRKSNLLATKKISATFHSISIESDDATDTPKSKVLKKKLQPDAEIKKNKRGRKKKEPITMTTCYCMICKKQFRRPDNYVRHQMTLLHVSKLCEVELNIKTLPIVEETNYLIAYKNELDKIKKQAEEDKRLNKQVLIPSLEEILVEVHKSVRAQQLSRRGLSRDEALFLDCCELLKKSHQNDLHERNAVSITKDVQDIALPQCSKPLTDYSHEIESEDKSDLRSDYDVDSITAKNILESEEVRNLENDLICGLKEAAEMHSRNELKNENELSVHLPSDNALMQVNDVLNSKDVKSCENLNTNSNTHPDSNICVESEIPVEKKKIEDFSKDIALDESPNNVSSSDISKIKKSLEVKDKMYPDIDNIDIFEDKFDKIKRKCRSQAAAARKPQMALESTLRGKRRKMTGKTKVVKSSKKKHNTILTKGALKGFDNVKESIPSSHCNITTEIQGENHQRKKKIISGSKRKKVKKVNKDENNDTRVKESSSGEKKIDVYEFMDNDAELFEFRPSTLMERFKTISYKDTLNRGMHKSSLDNDTYEFTSESGSDGDDFVYMSDDYVVGSDNETENSVISYETENGTEIKKSVKKRRDVTEKNAVMGKIFKNNAVRSEKRLAKYRESAKHKANLDKLFDSLLSQEPTTIHNNPINNDEEKQSLETYHTVKNKQNYNFLPPEEHSVRKRKRSFNTARDRDEVSTKKSNLSPSRTNDDRSYDEKLKVTLNTSFLTEEKKDCINDDSLLDERVITPQRARRKCTVGKQNVLAETWSSESEADGVPLRPNSVESDTTVVGRKRKVKKKESNASSSRRNKQKVTTKKQHKSNRIGPTSAKTRGKTVNDTHDAPNEGKRMAYADDPYHMPIASTSGMEGSSKGRSRSSSYYWSGETEDEQEHQQQHGWIVGDSHKKLVTMLAHAKGRKRSNDNSLID